MSTIASQKSRELLGYLGTRRDEMESMILELAKLESPSSDPKSQLPIQTILQIAIEDRGYRVRKLYGQKSGGHLLAVPRQRVSGRPIQLLLGHCDTVWPIGTLDKMPAEIRDGKLFGPGVYDMKAGLVQSIFAIEAIQSAGIEPAVTPVLLINSDEEIGSGESKRYIKRLARMADRAFVTEPSLGPKGKLKTARKGVGRFQVRVIGKASHAGLAPEQGVSAILELSHVVQELFALNDPERGITVNVGTIDGGLRANVVAPESRAEVDVRVATEADARRVQETIFNMEATTPGATLEITGQMGRPPMEKTPRNELLWNLAREACDELGIEIDDATAGGGSDGNWTNQLTATLDGLGAVGDGAHALTEHISTEHLVERTALLARLLLFPRLRVEQLSQLL